MRVEILRKLALQPEIKADGPQTCLLPVIDSWYAYHRTLASVLLFRGATTTEDIYTTLRTSLRRALNDFPRLLATLQPCTITSCDESKRPLQRVKAIWGTETSGGEFVEARTNARIESLLPPSTATDGSSYLWDRSAKSLRGLSPRNSPETTALRVQVTRFRCGGFGIALDLDHALADAHTVGLLLQRWSYTYSQMYGSGPQLKTNSALPEIVPSTDDGVLPVNVANASILLEEAAQFPTRRPDRRTIDDKSPLYEPHGHPESRPSAPPKPAHHDGTPYLLHLAEADYQRILQRVRGSSEVSVTDKIALMSVLWTVLNRARDQASLEPIDLEVIKSYRDTLGLPDGTIGCPSLSVIINLDQDTLQGQCNVSTLARRMGAILDAYDETAVRAIAYDGSLRDSPTSSFRPGVPQERLYFTSGMHSRSLTNLHFGPYSPAFCAPVAIPIDNLFMMADRFTKSERVDGKWHRSGIDLYFCLSPAVLSGLLSDPHLASVERLSDF